MIALWETEARPLLGHGLVGDQRGHEPDVVFRQQRRRGFVKEVSMLDAADSVAYGQLDGFRRVGMGRHIGFSIARLRHRRPDLLRRVLGAVEGIHGRGHAPGHVNFQEIGTRAKHVAGGLSHRIGPIGHDAKGAMAHLAGAIGNGQRSRLHIPVASGLGNHEIRLNNARTADHPAADGTLKPHHIAAKIAHGGKAAAHRVLCELRHGNAELHFGPLRQARKVQGCKAEMHMGVDEAGHEKLPVGIHHRIRIGAIGAVQNDPILDHQGLVIHEGQGVHIQPGPAPDDRSCHVATLPQAAGRCHATSFVALCLGPRERKRGALCRSKLTGRPCSLMWKARAGRGAMTPWCRNPP